MQADRLFSRGDLRAGLVANVAKASSVIDSIPDEKFLGSIDEELLEHVYSILNVLPLELHEDGIRMEKTEIQVDVRNDFTRAVLDKSKPCLVAGIRVVISVPFTGNPSLWDCQPSVYGGSRPSGRILSKPDEQAGSLELTFDRPTDTLDQAELKKAIDGVLDNVRYCIGLVKRDVDQSNEELRHKIRNHIGFRRKALAKHAEVLKALSIPLKPKSGSPDYSTLPIRRRIVRPLPTVRKKPDEPSISDEDYEATLAVIRHTGRSFECAPATFAVHDEEGLRDIMLASLNGIYEGASTAERFRAKGKTDICIEDKERAAFIAECKVWRGAKELSEAMDQLLGYHTWRDCKSSLVVFNKDIAGFSALTPKLEQALREHSKYVRSRPCDYAGEWRLAFHSMYDPGHSIAVHVFFLNLYVKRRP